MKLEQVGLYNPVFHLGEDELSIKDVIRQVLEKEKDSKYQEYLKLKEIYEDCDVLLHSQ